MLARLERLHKETAKNFKWASLCVDKWERPPIVSPYMLGPYMLGPYMLGPYMLGPYMLGP
jgi:hypothetical protein